MNLLKNKKHTETRKETAPLKMKRGQKKLFALYAVMVLSICIRRPAFMPQAIR